MRLSGAAIYGVMLKPRCLPGSTILDSTFLEANPISFAKLIETEIWIEKTKFNELELGI